MRLDPPLDTDDTLPPPIVVEGLWEGTGLIPLLGGVGDGTGGVPVGL